MTPFVVDTNVLVVANGDNPEADIQCRLACVDRLNAFIEDQLVAIDDQGFIFEEYTKRVGWAGGPGVGAIFFKHVWNHQYDSKRVVRVSVTPSNDEGRGFEELPPNSFDPDDRKFLAVAVVEEAVVLNATDGDWEEHSDLMQTLAVEVHQLCPQHPSKQAASESRRS